MDASEITIAIQDRLCQAATLLLYQGVLANSIGQSFLELLRSLSTQNRITCLYAYGRWFQALAARGQSWQEYLVAQILADANPFSQQAQQVPLADLPAPLVAAAQQDLMVLHSLYQFSGEQIAKWVQIAAQLSAPPVAWNPGKIALTPPIFTSLATLAAHYRQYGVGIFAGDRAFRWQSGKLVGIHHPDPIQLSELVGCESQKAVLLQNTDFLLAGYPALHVLLYGSRGAGKSSLVKALLNHYRESQLRLIEVAKSDLADLPAIADQLRPVPQKFILFVDDLSFEEDDEAFKALKVVLEGNITARPQNLVVYATSNRRHLIREFFGDRPRPRDADEIQAWDTVQEKLSFSDRFGLSLTFEPADQTTYLEIISHLAAQAKINLTPEDLEYRALQWATCHNGRSGRTARQFIDFLRAELALSKPKLSLQA